MDRRAPVDGDVGSVRPGASAFLQGMRDIVKGLHVEYRGGSQAAATSGNAMVNRGAGELSVAYRELFDVSRRSCPGSFLASQSPG